MKWTCQPENRSNSWRGTIIAQRQELEKSLEKGVLRNHAEAVLTEAFADALERAVAETGLAKEKFPATCPWTVDQLLSRDILNLV